MVPLRSVSWLVTNGTANSLGAYWLFHPMSANTDHEEPPTMPRMSRPHVNSNTAPLSRYCSGVIGSPLARMTSWTTHVSSGSSETIAATSSGDMCFAASIRKPSTPRLRRSSR